MHCTAGVPDSVLHHPPQAGSHGCRRWVFRRNLLQLIGAVHHAVQVQIRSSPADPDASTIRTAPSARPCRPADESSSSVRSSVPKPVSIINVYGNKRWASIINDPSSYVQIRRPQETHLDPFARSSEPITAVCPAHQQHAPRPPCSMRPASSCPASST
ncbi:hypothetical protein ACLOJK_006955 [Asimina triloba]